MGKQHNTFPEETPQPKETPEIRQFTDPNEPEEPHEDPQIIPDDFPPGEQTTGTPVEPEVR